MGGEKAYNSDVQEHKSVSEKCLISALNGHLKFNLVGHFIFHF